MTSLGRTAALTLSTVLLAGIPALSSPASAAPAKEWRTIGTFHGAKHQACKTTVDGKWKVFNRLVNGRQGRVGAGMNVYKDGEVVRGWRSELIAEGRTSPVGSVMLPKNNDRFSLDHYEFEENSGDGGEITIAQIHRC